MALQTVPDNNLQIIFPPVFFQFLSMRIASMSPVLYGFGMDSDGLHDHAQVWWNKQKHFL